MEVMTVHRADGREISLEELPWDQALSADETVRADQFVLWVLDGLSVRASLNASPVRSTLGPQNCRRMRCPACRAAAPSSPADVVVHGALRRTR